MTRIKFVVPGVPMAWKRPRATVRFGHASMFESKDCSSYKADIRSYLLRQCGKAAPSAEPMRVCLHFVFPLNKGDYKKDGVTPNKHGKAKLGNIEARAKKPDVDNLSKLVRDALNGVVWIDDSQIISLTAFKEYGTEPCTEVFVTDANR